MCLANILPKVFEAWRFPYISLSFENAFVFERVFWVAPGEFWEPFQFPCQQRFLDIFEFSIHFQIFLSFEIFFVGLKTWNKFAMKWNLWLLQIVSKRQLKRMQRQTVNVVFVKATWRVCCWFCHIKQSNEKLLFLPLLFLVNCFNFSLLLSYFILLIFWCLRSTLLVLPLFFCWTGKAL